MEKFVEHKCTLVSYLNITCIVNSVDLSSFLHEDKHFSCGMPKQCKPIVSSCSQKKRLQCEYINYQVYFFQKQEENLQLRSYLTIDAANGTKLLKNKNWSDGSS